jgi:hypothetical protein
MEKSESSSGTHGLIGAWFEQFHSRCSSGLDLPTRSNSRRIRSSGRVHGCRRQFPISETEPRAAGLDGCRFEDEPDGGGVGQGEQQRR